MMSRPARIAVWSAAGLLGLVLTAIIGVFIVANTGSGRALIARETAELTDGHVRIAGIHGSFPAALDLDRLELHDADGLWLWADHISLRWSPGALLVRHVNVDSLRVALLHVERSPVPTGEQKTSSSTSLPRTDVSDLTINTLELGEPLAGAPTSVTVKGKAHLRSMEEADIHLTARRIAGDGDYEINAHLDPQSTNATLKLQEPAHGPLENLVKAPNLGALSVLARLTGPRNAQNLQLSLEAVPLQARVNGRIDLEQAAADLTYSLSAPRMSPYAGLSWEEVELHGRLQGPFRKPAADGHLLIRSLQAPGGAQLAELDAQLKGTQGLLDLQARIDGLQIPGAAPRLLAESPLTLHGSVRLDEARRPLELTANHRLFTLDAKALTAQPQSAVLHLRLPDLKPFTALSGTQLQGDARVDASVDYSTGATKLTANVGAHLDAGTAAWAGLVRDGRTQLQLAAELTEQRLVVQKLQLTGSAISLTADARADMGGEQQTNLHFDLGLPDLHRVSAALAGDMKVTGSVEGPRQQLSVDTRLTTNLSVRGSPRGAVSARVTAKGLPKSPQGVLEASGQLDAAPLQAHVEVRPASNGTYRALIRRLDWKSAHADGDVTVGKTVAEARGNARIRLADLRDFSRLVGSQLSGSVLGELALLSASGHPRARLDFRAQNVVAAGVMANARLNAEGPINALKVTLDADSPAIAGQPARINTTAIINLEAKELQLASFKASYRDQDLQLLKPAKAQFAQGLRIQQLRLGIQDATVELDGRVSPALDLRAAVRRIKPELVNAFVPGLLSSGTVGADATIQGPTTAPRGTVHFQALGVKAKNAAAAGLPPADLRAKVNLKGDVADIDAHLSAGSSSKLVLTGRAPLSAGGAANLKLAGNLDLALANPLLEAGGRHVTGTLTIDTSVTGNTASPRIAGTVQLHNGSLRDYTQGVGLTDITGELTGSQGVLRIQRLTARAAPGNISISGTVGVLQPRIPLDIRVTAKNAQPVASNIVTANLNADIEVKGSAREQMDVTGKVHLNRANVTIPGGLPPQVAVLDVDREGAAPEAPPAQPLLINLHLEVEAPNRILISGRGLDAEMGGHLRIRGTTLAPVIEGGFELQRGFFTLANSKLRFTKGTVTFAGTGLQNKLDPALDFTAETKAAEVTAVVRITGLADAPQIELTSTPELPQDEILARLLFGEPAAQLSAFQLLQTGAALASLRGGSNDSALNPVGRIQKALGLDRLAVAGGSSASSSSSSTQQSSGTSVEAGRYVSSRVYVGVKESTTGASKVNVDVDLTERLKLQAQLGNGTATAQGVTPENDPGSSLGLAYQLEY